MTPEYQYNEGKYLYQIGRPEEACRMFRDAYQGGIAEAAVSLGDYYYDRGDYSKAEEWYLRGASAGVAEAMHCVGVMYQNRGDYQSAYKWYTKAAAHRYPASFEALGYMYQYGKGVGRNISLAIEYYEQGANLGDSNCIEALEAMD